MAAEGGFEAPSVPLVSRRLKERLFVWRKLFLQNWALFKASRIGVVGLAIMIAFVLLALAAPFMGLRDPIRWTAPDEDLISVNPIWALDSRNPGELRNAPPVTQPIVFRVLPGQQDARADRIYVTMENRLYALKTEPDSVLQGTPRNAWVETPLIRRFFNVSAVDGVQRTISVPPVVVNYGSFEVAMPDYEIHLGTDDGYVVFVRDTGTAVPPATSPRIQLDGPITGLASFNGDTFAPFQIQGQANHVFRSGSQWVIDRFTGPGDVGEHASLALNATDGVRIAFYDVSVGTPRIATLDRGRWSILGFESVNMGQYTSLAIGSDGNPRVAYYDEGDGALKYAQWNGVAWVREYVDAAPENVGQYASLALDGNTPHIAYYDASNGDLKYAANTSGTWTVTVIDGDGLGPLDVGRYASLALTATGTPNIAYYDASNGDLKVASWTGVWTNATVDGQTGDDVGQYADLAVDGLGNLYVAYYDASNGDLRFISSSGVLWNLPQVADGDGPGPLDVGRYASIALDGASNPAIAYENVTGLDLKYARWNGTTSTFDLETVASTGHIGQYNSLAFDSAGDPHIASYSFSTGRTEKDLIVVGTATGSVYGIDVGIPGDITRLSGEKQVSSWDYRIRWQVALGSEVHLASGPLRSISRVPLFSPAFTTDGSAVFVGTQNGTLHALRTSDGSSFWTDGTGAPRSFRIGSPWTTAPVVASASEGPLANQEVIYATSSHIDFDGPLPAPPASLLFALNATAGEPIPEWRDWPGFSGFGGGVPVSPNPTRVGLDTGDLSQPTEDGGTIYFGSTSGYFYAYRRDALGEFEPGSLKWTYRDNSLVGLDPEFTSPPIVDRQLERVLVTANHNNGTADPSDDRGVVYSLKLGTPLGEDAIVWKRTLAGRIPGAPASWKPRQSLDLSVWVGYGGSGFGGVAALSNAGQFLAPSPPSWIRPYPSGNQYWLGLDSQGRDIFSQVIWGSRIALLVGFLSAFFTVVLGVIVGLIAGYVGGKVEAILMRFTDVILVLPGLPLIITLAAVLGASIWNIILVISLLGWPGIARIIRAEVLSLKERPFIDSARVSGASTTRIVFKHIAPNVMPLAFLYMTFSVSGAILTEAALSFIGLGDINTMSWGIMLQLVSQSKALTAWYWLLPPGLAITLISLAFFLVGRAFDEIVNPRLRKR